MRRKRGAREARRAREREGERSEPRAAASGRRRERNRASTHIFFSQGSHLAAAFWTRRRGRARERGRGTARGKGDGETRSAGARVTREEPAGIVGGRALCLRGVLLGLQDSWSPRPAAAQSYPKAWAAGWVAALRGHPSRRAAILAGVDLPVWGFSTPAEGLSLRRRNFFSFFLFVCVCPQFAYAGVSLLPFPPQCIGEVLATFALAEGKGLRWRGWWPRMGW